jgi:hypothetical protein
MYLKEAIESLLAPSLKAQRSGLRNVSSYRAENTRRSGSFIVLEGVVVRLIQRNSHPVKEAGSDKLVGKRS